MEKVKNYLNYIGLALIFLSIVSIKIWPYKKTVALVIALIGVAILAAYIIFNISILKQSFKRKSFLYSSNLFLIIILALAILTLINYLLARNHYRIDFTESKLHSLSDQSVKVVKSLRDEIKIKCFFRDDNFSRGKMENLMKIYAYHSKKIKYEFIDPDKNPGLVKRYEITTDGTTIFESGDKDSRITSSSEEDITNAIIKISREKKKIVYFLEGHGEASIEETEERGFSQAKDELEKLGYEVKKLSLALSDTFPKDCALLVIPGPQKDLLPNELETIGRFLKEGGRLFLMVDPEMAPGLKSFLKQYGIKLADDLVVDTVSRLLGGDYFMPVVSEYEYHEITENFRYATFYPYARSVEVVEDKLEGVSVKSLAKSSPRSWSERELDQREVAFNDKKDKAGPVSIAAVVTLEIKKEENEKNKEVQSKDKAEIELEPKEKEGRLAVFGDSDFASNGYYNLSGNGNFFLNTVNWLTEEADLISIQPKTSSPRAIQLTPSQGRLIFFTSIIILPLVVLIVGISVWVRRRSK
ncbi:MAG: GldG family protein [Candidatus Aminicenantaceae bacterium]